MAAGPTITQLEYILAVFETGHFGRAAARVGISQPTLSAQIHKAEVELGVTIFDRRTKPIEATPPGRAVIEHAQQVVDAHQSLVRHAAGKFEEPAGRFALGVIPTLAPYVLPWFLRRFAQAYPAVELAIYERPTDELVTEMVHNRVDAALLATPLDERAIEERVLFHDPFYVYGHPDEALLRAAEVEVEELDPRKLWLLEDGHCVRTQVINFCGIREREHLGSVSFAGGSLETLRRLIDASEGYTLIPETYARTLTKATRRRCVRAFASRTPTREISLVHHRRTWKRDILDALEAEISASIPRALAQVDGEGETLPVRVR
ncbi:Hydrogen peroxide-inducible protein activator [Enhygromyxa salina]|uniref:Hydrogen peroxide-inducible protein activator n=1 Tax=Enhygromyxa salina TaxID=215803 RepID=A0A2S9XV88_9BACT|nr:hydrogen peroxide-inducible genes activator [Enhygromyxa salina]PRP96787.1 Hydrogen peroxide-inducible protein activator [Enhygromyxa salina]